MAYLSDMVAEQAAAQPDAEAVVFEETRLSYGQLNERVNRLANGLGSLGLRRASHVALLLENCHQYLELYYALSKAGMVAVPLNWRLSDEELNYVVDHSESVALIADEAHAKTARVLRDRIERLEGLIGLEITGAADMTPYEEIVAAGSPAEPNREGLDESGLVVLMYTGGTTGLPKGVMLSHRNLLAAVRAIAGIGMQATGARTLFALPLFHIANWQAFLFHALGGCVVISRRADPKEILDLLQREKPVLVNLVPTVYQGMLSLPGIEEVDVSFVGRFTTSGAPMPPEIMRRCEQVFRIRFGKGYGLTEAAPAVSSLSPDEYALEGDPLLVKRSRSVGKPLPGVDVAVRREDGSECGPEEQGEITVSGENVMLGYWRDPERTRQALRDGWLWTGDLGLKDEDGYLYLVDRKGDMIISGGENVHPTETENALAEHPAVREVAVVGVPDPKWGEAVKAVVALEPDREVTAEELITFCKGRIAGYKCPRSVDFVDELPKSTVGKILRREVRNRYSGSES
ncbi:MAG: long-chain-fatty-acid--CoA ligase [Planctomycetota bacterium]|jgi:acyl-CoA synthetase (AMP-forming)/AMP-acid ligase II